MSTQAHAVTLWETVCWHKGTWKLNITSNGTAFYLRCSVAGLALQIVDINLNQRSTIFVIREKHVFGMEK